MSAADRAARQPSTEWVSYGGTTWNQKYSALDLITRDNFKNLQVRTLDIELAKTSLGGNLVNLLGIAAG